MNVTLETAYAEACRALGESIVTERLLSAELQRHAAEVQRLSAEQATGTTELCDTLDAVLDYLSAGTCSERPGEAEVESRAIAVLRRYRPAAAPDQPTTAPDREQTPAEAPEH